MTVQIRKNVFETNSSSSHSLTVSQGDLIKEPFDLETVRRGTIYLEKGEYGWEWEQYFDTVSKLSYLFTQVMNDVPQGDAEELTAGLRQTNPRFDMLCRVVEEHTGVKVLVTPGTEGYIDHQSDDVGLELFRDEQQLKQFLFCNGSYVETDNDNH